MPVRTYNQDLGMEYGIEKGAMQVIRSGKWQMTEGIERPNKKIIRMLREKETYKFLGIFKVDTIKKAEKKEKNFKNVSQEDKKIT